MPVTDQQARAIAFLATASRPHGAPRWDEAGIVAAIAKVRHLALADVTLAAIRAADDRTLRTPGPIGNPASPCWRERDTGRPQPSKRSAGPWCRTCGIAEDDHPSSDHEFEQRAGRKLTPEAARDVVTELRGHLARTKTEG